MILNYFELRKHLFIEELLMFVCSIFIKSLIIKNNPMSSLDLAARVKILKTIGLFASVREEVLYQIAEVLVPKRLEQDEVLFLKGDDDHTFYIVVNGSVKAHVGEHNYACFQYSDFFGEYSLLDSSTRSTSVTALEPTELLGFEQKDFFKFLDENPSMTRAMLNNLVWRLRDYNILEAELTTKNIEIYKQKDILEVQRKELESLNSTKDKFFAIIAHDLKNPFSTVLGLSELLAKEFESFEPEKLKVFIEQIYKYSNNTFNLLENLLQWSMLQTGRMPLRPKLVNINELIAENIELLRGNAQQKGITIYSNQIDEGFVYIDMSMITTVVRNLLSNAIKFTNEGGVINIDITNEGSMLKFSINDNGVGVSLQDQSKLFKIDSNPTSIGTSMEKGTGLGLILCKDFVERNGGTIWLESQIGKGSTFYFTIPRVGENQSSKA
jgi:two-component system, sensor histidine kinase and response regulator